MQLSKHFEFDFGHSIENLWSLVSDTPRWGEACGLPRYQVQEQLQQDGRVKITGSLDVAGFNLSWEEPPVNWMQPLWFEQQRLVNMKGFDNPITIARINLQATHDRKC